MARPRKPLLSTQLIADAAMELIESGARFGVNALARRLGVNPSSLYHHVAGREEIIELVRGRLAEKYTLAGQDESWLDFVEVAVRQQRHMYAEHPLLIPLIVKTTITDAATIHWYDTLATRLAAAGIPEDELLAIVAVVDALAIGFGLDLAGPDVVWQPETETETLARAVAAAPHGHERADQAFEIGLSMLLTGLRTRYAHLLDDTAVPARAGESGE